MSIPDYIPLDQFRMLDWMSSRFPRRDLCTHPRCGRDGLWPHYTRLGLAQLSANRRLDGGAMNGAIRSDAVRVA